MTSEGQDMQLNEHVSLVKVQIIMELDDLVTYHKSSSV